jgi:hypothetical protein
MGENLEVVRAEFSTLSSAVYDEGIISCQFLPPGGNMVPTYVLQLLFTEKSQNC